MNKETNNNPININNIKGNCKLCNKEITRRVNIDTAINTAINLKCAEGFINYLKERKLRGIKGLVKNPEYDLNQSGIICLDCARKHDIKTEQDGYIISLGSCL